MKPLSGIPFNIYFLYRTWQTPDVPLNTTAHLHTRWTVAAECCDHAPVNGAYSPTNLFPCNEIHNGTGPVAEQAFATACEYYGYASLISF